MNERNYQVSVPQHETDYVVAWFCPQCSCLGFIFYKALSLIMSNFTYQTLFFVGTRIKVAIPIFFPKQ